MSLSSRIVDLTVAVREKINTMMPRLMPSGGNTGQVLTKTSNASYVVGWSDPAGGSGTIILDGNGLGNVPSDFILDGNG